MGSSRSWKIFFAKEDFTKALVVFYEQKANGKFKEIERYGLDPSCGRYGIQIPKGVWHTVDVVSPNVIIEVKDGKYQSI